MNWTTSFLWWPLMYRPSEPRVCTLTRRATSLGFLAPCLRPDSAPVRQLRARVGQVARQLVEVDEGLGRKDEIEPALQLLEAETGPRRSARGARRQSGPGQHPRPAARLAGRSSAPVAHAADFTLVHIEPLRSPRRPGPGAALESHRRRHSALRGRAGRDPQARRRARSTTTSSWCAAARAARRSSSTPPTSTSSS